MIKRCCSSSQGTVLKGSVSSIINSGKYSSQKKFYSKSNLGADGIDRSGLIWREPEDMEDEMNVHGMIRVDHAGELGAVTICKSHKIVLGEDPIVNEILSQEVDHFATFDKMIIERRVRPTIFRPLWEPAGVMLGVGTAMMGRNYAMACHEAIENTIFDHYNEQLRDIYDMSIKKSEEKKETTETSDTDYFFKSEHQKQEIQEKELRDIIKQYRDEELHHHDIAKDANTQRENNLLYKAVYGFVSTGCSLVISLTKRL